MMNRADKKFVQDTKDLFDASVDNLDAATLSKLNHARHQALDAIRSRRAARLRWIPAAGAVAAVLVAVLILSPGPGDVTVMPAAVTDMDILLDDDSLEMLDDLEFYSWIDAADAGDEVG